MIFEPRGEKRKVYRPMTLEELSQHPTTVNRFISRLKQGTETTITVWRADSVTLEGAPGDAEFRLGHPKIGMKDVLLRSGRLFQKFDMRDITEEFTPETTGQQRQDTQRKVEAA